ncbi:MAG TPA: DUF1697 domain-containing protein [Gaiellaceae bacterium]|jgi:uncharacterized protein (DUF1697 family)
MGRQIVLLRGINLASKRRVGMAELRKLLEAHGYDDVRTHLQSGNVVLTSRASPSALKRKLEKELADGLRMEIEVFVRTRDELADVVKRNPLGKVADNGSRYIVYFLSAKPSAKVVKELAEADIGPDRVAASGRELYSWHPNGLQRSPLAKLLSGDRLGVSATNRNWNTVTKLLAIADE